MGTTIECERWQTKLDLTVRGSQLRPVAEQVEGSELLAVNSVACVLATANRTFALGWWSAARQRTASGDMCESVHACQTWTHIYLWPDFLIGLVPPSVAFWLLCFLYNLRRKFFRTGLSDIFRTVATWTHALQSEGGRMRGATVTSHALSACFIKVSGLVAFFVNLRTFLKQIVSGSTMYNPEAIDLQFIIRHFRVMNTGV